MRRGCCEGRGDDLLAGLVGSGAERFFVAREVVEHAVCDEEEVLGEVEGGGYYEEREEEEEDGV